MNAINVPTKYEAYLQSEQFAAVREKVFERDHYKCVVCGSEFFLQAHHLTYRNLYNEPTGDLITLCKTCHSIYHSIAKRMDAVESVYQRQADQRDEEWRKRIEDDAKESVRRKTESAKVFNEIKEEYLLRDYCKDGDLDMMDWTVLNKIIDRKCKEHNIPYLCESKADLMSFFRYRRCEFFLKCMDKGLSLQTIAQKTKFDFQYLQKWYRRDKCEAKLNEEKEILQEA